MLTELWATGGYANVSSLFVASDLRKKTQMSKKDWRQKGLSSCFFQVSDVCVVAVACVSALCTWLVSLARSLANLPGNHLAERPLFALCDDTKEATRDRTSRLPVSEALVRTRLFSSLALAASSRVIWRDLAAVEIN